MLRVSPQGLGAATWMVAVALMSAGAPSLARAISCPSGVEPWIPRVNDRFGSALARSGSTLFIAAEGDDDLAFNGGAIYVYELDGEGAPALVEKLFPEPPLPHARAGTTMAADGDRLLVGGIYTSNEELRPRTAWVFKRGRRGWQQEAALQHPESEQRQGDFFGAKVALSGDYAAILDFGGVDSMGWSPGSLEVFRRGEDGWVWQQRHPWTSDFATLEEDLLRIDSNGSMVVTPLRDGGGEPETITLLSGYRGVIALPGAERGALLTSGYGLAVLRDRGGWIVESEISLPGTSYGIEQIAGSSERIVVVHRDPATSVLTYRRADSAWMLVDAVEMSVDTWWGPLLVDSRSLYMAFPEKVVEGARCNSTGQVDRWIASGDAWVYSQSLSPGPAPDGCRVDPGGSAGRWFWGLLLLGRRRRRRC